LCTWIACAQQPDAPSASQGRLEKELQKKEQSQRILGVIPMFDVTSRKAALPLTLGQKFRLFVRSTYDPFEFASVGISAGANQANNDFPEYGQGAAGYAKRYGAGMADSTSAGFFGGFVYPVLLKQDPRYFRQGDGPTLRRFLHALGNEFVCRSDRGGREFNFSKILGVVTASGISNAYYPPGDRGLGATMNRAGVTMLSGSAGGLLDEFWPDIRRKVLRKKD
jgi:hypothetical protein